MLLCQQNEIYRGILEYTQARGHTSVKHVMLLYQQNIVNRGILEYTQTRSQTNVALSEQSHFQTRMRVHTGVKPYKCELCDAAFWFIVTLQNHIRKQHELKNLQTHIKIHAGEKPYKCETCDAALSTKGDLQRHFRIYTGERSYKCETCDAALSTKRSLQHVMLLSQQNYGTCRASFHRKNLNRYGRELIHVVDQ
ncbi:ZN235-like protein [Mya arenaria]|uniref:ZN235-like protein n=1 Tax=Mya arenaria TaxID=6604 RepID=A0ABY7FJI7_MYAAR|nr:ZN235-like protein [Mya arenaria]